MDGCVRAHRVGGRRSARRPALLRRAQWHDVSARCVRIGSRQLAPRHALSGRSSLPRDAGPRAARALREEARCAARHVGAARRDGRAARGTPGSVRRRRSARDPATALVGRDDPRPARGACDRAARGHRVAAQRGRAPTRARRVARRQRTRGPALATGTRIHRRRRRQAGARPGRAFEGRLPQPRPRRAADGERRLAAATPGRTPSPPTARSCATSFLRSRRGSTPTRRTTSR